MAELNGGVVVRPVVRCAAVGLVLPVAMIEAVAARCGAVVLALPVVVRLGVGVRGWAVALALPMAARVVVGARCRAVVVPLPVVKTTGAAALAGLAMMDFSGRKAAASVVVLALATQWQGGFSGDERPANAGGYIGRMAAQRAIFLGAECWIVGAGVSVGGRQLISDIGRPYVFASEVSARNFMGLIRRQAQPGAAVVGCAVERAEWWLARAVRVRRAAAVVLDADIAVALLGEVEFSMEKAGV